MIKLNVSIEVENHTEIIKKYKKGITGKMLGLVATISPEKLKNFINEQVEENIKKEIKDKIKHALSEGLEENGIKSKVDVE